MQSRPKKRLRKDHRTEVINQTNSILMNIPFESESIGDDNVDDSNEITEDDMGTLSACEDDQVELNTSSTVKTRNNYIQIASRVRSQNNKKTKEQTNNAASRKKAKNSATKSHPTTVDITLLFKF